MAASLLDDRSGERGKGFERGNGIRALRVLMRWEEEDARSDKDEALTINVVRLNHRDWRGGLIEEMGVGNDGR
ncbi:hypothetical protein EV1_019132 [Malus domestica]